MMEEILRGKKRKPALPFCAYLYDLRGLKEHARHLKKTLPSQVELYYAVKANSHTRILEALLPEVDGFEVASGGEMEKVRAVDRQVPMIFGGPAKTDEELKMAIRTGVKRIHAESAHEIARLARIADSKNIRVPILLRVNLRGPLPAGKLQMAGVPTQFGIDETEIPAAIEQVKRLTSLQLEGFHFHAMSNNLDAGAHAAFVDLCVKKAEAWAKEAGIRLKAVNVGGGIGISYTEPDRFFDWNRFVNELGKVLSPRASFSIILEVGRYLTAECGGYAAEVLDVKRNHGHHYAVLRGGTHHFRFPAAWKHSQPFAVVPVEEWPYPFTRPSIRQTRVTVAGELCTPNDVLAREVPVERLRVGDIILFFKAGAYGWDISHHDFLSHPHPEMIFIE